MTRFGGDGGRKRMRDTRRRRSVLHKFHRYAESWEHAFNELWAGSECLTKMVRSFEARNKSCEEQDLMVKSEYSSFVFSQVLPKLSSLKRFTMIECGFAKSDHLRLDVKPTPTFCNIMGHNARYHKEASMFIAAVANADTKLGYLYLERLNLNTLFGASIGTNTMLPYRPDARHAKTLRILKLQFCFLKESILDWGEVLDGIKSDLTLKEVHLCYLKKLLPEDQNTFDKAVHLEHVYHGNTFHSLLEDRLIRKNLIANELSLEPSELWQNYILYLTTEKQKAKVRLAELESQDLTWDFKSDEDMRLFEFIWTG
ncbi:uncharacterized protein Bfra_003531 [Botrytis fragariae]|uniref:Uncharacterized protein n=1 Tax=Botrytis fragariae TaxID=1964551 RepID=A0A8H6AWW9_9HELO|nr:uncharacterized protein Bfra_003531 [Botrytis fragariae]KAF5875077.1 hypothetical protein Bfra_003531 [Botrytis fragariae]